MVRLGVVYADSLRLTIITELWMREMTPKQFFDEVGGPSLDSVRKHFEKLLDYGWLRRVRKRSNGPGRPAFVYRTTELAVIDEETWAKIPFSIRDAFTLQLMQQLSERFSLALDAKTLEARDHAFSLLAPLVLDEAGWEQALKILSGCFRSLELEQTDAKVRLAEQQRPPILMIVAMAGFESPAPGSRFRAERVLPSSTLPLDTSIPWTIRLAKVFGDPISLRIVWKLNEAAMSPTELQANIGGASTQTFDRKCKALVDLGWVTVDDKSGGDGTRRVLYRATSPAVVPSQAWAIIPDSLRGGESWATYQQLCELVFEAVQRGTFNARDDRHLTWGTLLLDEVGWEQVLQTLRRSIRSLVELERGAKRRVAANKESITTTFFVGGFESPPLNAPPVWGDIGQGP